MSYIVACADIGSVRKGKFQWASTRIDACGGSPSSLAAFAAEMLRNGEKVALGFECPLSIPIPKNELQLGMGRIGEGNRPWSAGAGAGALATGLVQVTWVLAEVRRILGNVGARVGVALDVEDFERMPGPSLFLWEAFVSSSSKGENDREDAEIGVEAYLASRVAKSRGDVHCGGSPLSLIGVALARAGWIHGAEAFAREVYVVRAAV